jgi:hypothetical protein
LENWERPHHKMICFLQLWGSQLCSPLHPFTAGWTVSYPHSRIVCWRLSQFHPSPLIHRWVGCNTAIHIPG